MQNDDLVGIETWFNERYVRDISRKIRASLRYKIEKGEYIGRAPYGYRKAKDSKNKLEPDPVLAENVKLIFKLYSQGYGYGSIAAMDKAISQYQNLKVINSSEGIPLLKDEQTGLDNPHV